MHGWPQSGYDGSVLTSGPWAGACLGAAFAALRRVCSRRLVEGLALWGAIACSAASSPSADVSQVARDFNVATRFGRMDVASEHMAADVRSELLQSRAQWGGALRVVDIEVASLQVESSERAEVLVDVVWVRSDETSVQGTRLRQVWGNPGGGWQLVEESRLAGAPGLLGEPVQVLRPGRPRDVHLPSKTIR